jgi:hypothetical protein
MKVVVAYDEVLSLHLRGGTKKNHEKPHSGYPFSGPRLEPETPQI